jgi:predicted nucleic acid-binding protein
MKLWVDYDHSRYDIIVYLFLNSERSEQAEEALLKDPQWAAPILWRSELRNVLTMYMRKGFFSLDDTTQIIGEAEMLMRDGEYEIVSLQVLLHVDESICTAYGCEFVALARDLRVPLVTVDKQVLDQFPSDTISLDEFVG